MVSGKVLRHSLVFLLILALASPSALCLVNGTETDTFESLSAVLIDGEQAMSGKDAAVLRYGMDFYGNNDSFVSASEVTSFENRYENFVKQMDNEYTLNGIEGQFANMVVTFKNAEGHVNSTSELTFEYQGRITFTGIDDSLDLYTYRVVNEGGDPNSTMELQITVPSGYGIASTQGIYASETSGDRRTVSGHTLTDANVIIEFEPYDEWGWMIMPAFISAIISVALAGALAWDHVRSKKLPAEFGRQQPPGGEKGPGQ